MATGSRKRGAKGGDSRGLKGGALPARSENQLRDDQGVEEEESGDIIEVLAPDDVLPPERLADPHRESPFVVESADDSVVESFAEEDAGDAAHIEDEVEVLDRRDGEERSSRAIVPYNALDAYLAEIRRLPHLSKEAEHEAAVQYHSTKSPEAAYTLVSGNLWLVVKIARDYERVARNILDIIQEGNIGLMEAVRNFDPYRGVRFPSYAVWWIKAYIIRYIISNWRLVKIGTTQAQRKLFFNLKKESERLEREGIFPAPKLLAEKLHVRESDVVEMSQRLAGSDVSVDAPLQDDGESNLHSVLASSNESVEEVMARRQLHDALRESLQEFEEGLNVKEGIIFHGRVVGDEKRTLQDISDELSLSKERVRQIESKLREKLKQFVSSKLGGELENWVDTAER